MSISNFGELKTAVETWRERIGADEILGNAADFIRLGEANLSRKLKLKNSWVNTPLTGTVDSRNLTLPLDFAQPRWLKMLVGSTYVALKKQSSEDMFYIASSGTPFGWTINGLNIELDRPASSGYLSYQFRYRQRFALADSALPSDTNWLLTYHPDIYLAAVLLWSGLLIKDADIQIWKPILMQGIRDLNYEESLADGDVEATVDLALQKQNVYGRYDITTDTFI